MDYPLTGFEAYLTKTLNFSPATTANYVSAIRRALRVIPQPITTEALGRHVVSLARPGTRNVFRCAWRTFESYASRAGESVAPLPPMRGAGRPKFEPPPWAWALHALTVDCRLPLRAIFEARWSDVTFGIKEGSVRWLGAAYPVPANVLRVLREAAMPSGAAKLNPYSPLVPETLGAPEPMSEWRMKQIVAHAEGRKP